jgi:hypothetical protein
MTMGVSVRMTRNTRVWLPWWLAVPVGLCVAAGWVVRLVVVVVPVAAVRLVRAMCRPSR